MNRELKEVQLGPKILEIPEEWDLETLTQVSDVNMGSSPKSKFYNENGDGVPFYQGNADFGDIHPETTTWCTEPQKIADENDILISVRAPVGEINIVLEESCIGRGVAAIKSKEADTKFLFYSLLQNEKRWEAYSQGSTFESINKDVLENFPLPIPEISEQKKIAGVLSQVDEVIRDTETIIEETEELKKGLMQDLLTKGIDHDEFKEVKIGPKTTKIPASWECKSFRDVAEFRNGINFTGDQKGESGLPTIDVLNMYGDGINLSLEQLYCVDKEIKDDYLLEKGDILFVRSSLKKEGVGWASLVPEFDVKATYCGFLIRARLRESDINPEFLIRYLRHDPINHILVAGAGEVANTNLTQSDIGRLDILIPPLEEQERIARLFKNVDEKIESEKEFLDELKQLKKGLMQDLLTGKVRVNELELEAIA